MKREKLHKKFSHIDQLGREILFNLTPPDVMDIDSAKLRLEFLKENFEFQEFFEVFCQNPEKYLSISPIPQKDYPKKRTPAPLFTRSQTGKPIEDLGYYFSRFGLNSRMEMILWFIGWPFSDFLDFFNPAKDTSSIDNQDLINCLPIIFSDVGIQKYTPGSLHKFFYDCSKPDFKEDHSWKRLGDYEHILIVDLRKRKSQLKKEFEKFIDNQISYQQKVKNRTPFYISEQTYLGWSQENDRLRKEAAQQLEIWQLRKKHLSFDEIARKLGIEKDTAKKGFYRAYELSQNKRYDKLFFTKMLKEVKKTDLKKTCESCSDRETCNEPCPEILSYADKDTRTSLREQLLDEERLQQRADYEESKTRGFRILPKKQYDKNN